MESAELSKVLFDRQMRIDKWNQEKIGQEVVLCLGVGGLGSVVVIDLLRLGVKKIMMVDYDKVEYHNLNRQLLFSLNDVGKTKIDAALANLKIHNINNIEVEGYNFDATKNFDKIIEMAKESTMIFNMIDVGDYWDLAIQSLCLKLKKKMILGGTFSGSLSIDFYPANGRPCYLCLTDGLKPELIEKLAPQNILNLLDISFVPRNNNPIGQSNVYLASICSNFMVSLFVNSIFGDEPQDLNRFIFYVNSFEVVKFETKPNEKCPYYNPPENLHSSKKKTLFISKLPSNINEEQLQEKFSKYGKIRSLNLIKDLITGEKKGYGFLEYKHFDDAFYVYRKFRKNKQKINTNEIQIDFERARNQKGWKPRRLGGGVGGNKRSGQLRFP